MPMYNLLGYSKNYRKTIGSLYNYYRDELSTNVVNSNVAEGADGHDANRVGKQDVELAIPLKYLVIFGKH